MSKTAANPTISSIVVDSEKSNMGEDSMEEEKVEAGVYSPVIGIHLTPLSQKFGIPRQSNLVAVPSCIKMYTPYDTPEAFIGIEGFSHLWITWQTHHNRVQNSFKPCVRPPRLGGNDKRGVFATRSTYRPSSLGLSVVRLTKVEVINGSVTLYISGADMVDGTPIIDIKPYVAYSDIIANSVSGFAADKPINKRVQISDMAQAQFEALIAKILQKGSNKHSSSSKNNLNDSILQSDSNYTSQLLPVDMKMICQLISQDPRPAYKQNDTERVYVMRYKNVDVHFKMDYDANGNERMLILAVCELNELTEASR